jgi:serine/threonine protein phosphatase PrpC
MLDSDALSLEDVCTKFVCTDGTFKAFFDGKTAGEIAEMRGYNRIACIIEDWINHKKAETPEDFTIAESSDIIMNETVEPPLPNLLASFGMALHDGYKSPSEDRAVALNICPDVNLYGIFDGHGGQTFSDLASTLLPDRIKTRILFFLQNVENCSDKMMVDEVSSIFIEELLLFDLYFTKNDIYSNSEEAIRWIKGAKTRAGLDDYLNVSSHTFVEDKRMLNQRGLIDCGTTASLVLTTRAHIISATVGDSPCIIFSKETGSVSYNSIDHSPTCPLESARIISCGGELLITDNACRVKKPGTFSSGLLMTRALGQKSYKDISISLEGQTVNAEPQINVWSREQKGLILSLASDSFGEALRPEVFSSDAEEEPDQSWHDVPPHRIGPFIEPSEIALLLHRSIKRCNGHMQLAAEDAVKSQVEKFHLGGYFQGDNTSLILVDLDHEFD